MNRSKTSSRKRLAVVLSSTVMVVSLLTGCGSADKAQSQPSSASQPSSNSAAPAASDDVLAQFPAVKLPFDLDATAVVSEYQGGKMTGQEFITFLRFLAFTNPQQGMMIPQATNDVVKDYVRQYTATKILSSRADQAMQAESKKKAESIYEKIKSQYMSMLNNDEAKFNKLMEGHKLTKDDIINQMTLINNSVEVLQKGVNQDELKKIYDKTDKAQFTTASVRHILISTDKRKPEEALKLANDLEARLKKGEDFAKLAKQYTDDPGSKENGGLYENADVNNWVPEFKQAALTQKVGEIGAPVKTTYGYHIIRVEKRTVQTFDQVKDQLSQNAVNTEYEKFMKNDLDKLVTKWNVPQVKQVKK